MLNVITFRRVVSLVSPGALLLFVVWAIQQDESVREASVPYAAFISFGTLGAAALLSWYHNYARVFFPTAVVGLVMWTFGRPDSDPMKLWIALLVPLNFILTAALKERGLMTLEGAFQGGILLMQLLLVQFLGQSAPESFTPSCSGARIRFPGRGSR